MIATLPVLNGSDAITHSRIQSFKECHYRHYLAYELGLRPDRQPAPFRFGGSFHEALDEKEKAKEINAGYDAIYKNYAAIPEWADIDDWNLEQEKVLRLYGGYCWRWKDDEVKIVASEHSFDIPIVNPETGRSLRNFKFRGKLDKIVKWDGRLAVMEHKTTGDSIKPDSDYWGRLRIDSQISGYMVAARETGYPVETVLYDVIHKPGMGRLKATPKDQRKYRKDGKLYANMREVDETTKEYGDRLSADIAERPDFYYARKEIPRLDADLDNFRRELCLTAWDIRNAQRMGLWHQNTNACKNPYPCQYRNICWNGIRPTPGEVPDGFIVVENIHPELEESTP